VYVKEGTREYLLIICLYADGLHVFESNIRDSEIFKKTMEVEFNMTNLGKLSYFQDMELTYIATGLVMH